MSNELEPSQLNELRTLFAASSNELLTDEQHSRLQEMLTHNAEARHLWFLHCDIELGLADWAAQSAAGAESETVPLATRHKRSLRVSLKHVAIMVAAVLLIGVAIRLAWRTPAESAEQGVALLAHAAQVEWASEADSRATGSLLQPGWLRLKSGAVLVEFYDGARLVVEGPAELQLISASESLLKSGRINAHVPQQARGFKVRTMSCDVVDRGTDFGLAVVESSSGGATAEVHVFEGLVDVQATDAPTTARALNTGEAVRLEREQLVEIEADRSAFLLEAELVQREADAERQRFDGWRAASAALSADPAIVLHYSVEDGQGATLIDQAARSNGSIVGCEWVTGRWASKPALRFHRSSDRVRILAERPLQQITLLAWVRVDALSSGMTSLMAVEAERVGAMNWLITERGQLRMEVGRDLGHRKLDWEAVNSDPVVTSDRYGQWLMLATTFDGSTIRHFINGRACGHGASFKPPSLQIGMAEVGNGRAAPMRHLNGALDEFAIVGRVMSENELLAYFERGRP
jgi:hypothetical protein